LMNLMTDDATDHKRIVGVAVKSQAFVFCRQLIGLRCGQLFQIRWKQIVT